MTSEVGRWDGRNIHRPIPPIVRCKLSGGAADIGSALDKMKIDAG